MRTSFEITTIRNNAHLTQEHQELVSRIEEALFLSATLSKSIGFEVQCPPFVDSGTIYPEHLRSSDKFDEFIKSYMSQLKIVLNGNAVTGKIVCFDWIAATVLCRRYTVIAIPLNLDMFFGNSWMDYLIKFNFLGHASKMAQIFIPDWINLTVPTEERKILMIQKVGDLTLKNTNRFARRIRAVLDERVASGSSDVKVEAKSPTGEVR